MTKSLRLNPNNQSFLSVYRKLSHDNNMMVTDLFIALLPNHGTYSFLCFHLKAFNSRIAHCFVEFNLCWWIFVRILFFPQESSGEKKEYLFKVLVIGDLGVGKTSIIKRYVHQFFSVHYRATISFFRFKSTGKFIEHIFFNHSPTYVTHLITGYLILVWHTHIRHESNKSYFWWKIWFCLSII